MSSGSNRSEPFTDQNSHGAGSTPTPTNQSSSGAATAAAAAAAGPPLPKKPIGDVVLELRGVSKSFPIEGEDTVVHALRDVTMCDELAATGRGVASIRRGEFVMIRGASGGGKTTCLNMIGLLDTPTGGEISIMGNVIRGSAAKDRWKREAAGLDDDFLSKLRLRHIGYTFQTFNLLSTMTALENVELPMTLLGELTESERKSRAKKLLSLVGLRNRMNHLPSELSGGEQQRVTIARSLANNPDLLLLDEPTGDLDTATTIQVMDLLCQINYLAGGGDEPGPTMIMVTHNPDLSCYADRVIFVGDGRIIAEHRNLTPQPLVLEEYEKYLKSLDSLPLSAVHHGHGHNEHHAAPGTRPAAPAATPVAAAGTKAAAPASSPAPPLPQSADDVVAAVKSAAPVPASAATEDTKSMGEATVEGQGAAKKERGGSKSNKTQSQSQQQQEEEQNPSQRLGNPLATTSERLDSDLFEPDSLFRRHAPPPPAAAAAATTTTTVPGTVESPVAVVGAGDSKKSKSLDDDDDDDLNPVPKKPSSELPDWRRAAEARTAAASGRLATTPAVAQPKQVLANGEQVPAPDPYVDRDHQSPKNTKKGDGFSADDL